MRLTSKEAYPADCPLLDSSERIGRRVRDMCGGLIIAGTFACVALFAVAYGAYDVKRGKYAER